VILKGNERLAKELVTAWLTRVNKSIYHTATRGAQNVQKVGNITDACNELFKYTTKILASSGKAKDNNGNWNKSDYINVASLDRILQATTRKRTVQPFGFVAPKEQPTNSEKQTPESIHVFDQEQKAYFEYSTGEQSTPKSLPKHVKMLISKVEKQAARDRVNPPNIYESYTIKKAHQLDKADSGNIGHHKSNSSPGGDG
jgi:hypothetical protein